MVLPVAQQRGTFICLAYYAISIDSFDQIDQLFGECDRMDGVCGCERDSIQFVCWTDSRVFPPPRRKMPAMLIVFEISTFFVFCERQIFDFPFCKEEPLHLNFRNWSEECCVKYWPLKIFKWGLKDWFNFMESLMEFLEIKKNNVINLKALMNVINSKIDNQNQHTWIYIRSKFHPMLTFNWFDIELNSWAT